MATGDILTLAGTAVVFNGEAGADVAFSIEGAAATDGQVSARYDIGALSSARATLFEVRFSFGWATTPVIGEAVRVYMFTSDGTYEDSDVGTADAAVTVEDTFVNGKKIWTGYVSQADAAIEMNGSVTVEINARYVSFGVWNGTADAFNATDANSRLILTPLYQQVQS